jgi:hypothetical protein
MIRCPYSNSSENLVLFVNPPYSPTPRAHSFGAPDRLGERFVFHTSIFEHISPFATSTSMTMLQMLPEMIRPEKLLGMVAFPELMHLLQVSYSEIPVLLCCYSHLGSWRRRGDARTREIFATISTRICLIWTGWRCVECGRVTRKRSARPRMAAKMQRILVSFCFILVLETIGAICTFVLLFLLVDTRKCVSSFFNAHNWEDLLQFFLRIKLLRFFRAAIAHKNSLNLGGVSGFSMAHTVG